jgi:tetratricopeptide (TPR) repeat protein
MNGARALGCVRLCISVYLDSFIQVAQRAFDEGDYRGSAQRWREAAEMGRRRGATPRVLAGILNGLGVACKGCGAFDEAEQAYQSALKLLEQEGVDDQTLATLYHNLGGLEHARGNCAKGEPLARKSVELRERALGPDALEVGCDLAALAALLDCQGKFNESAPLYLRALDIFEHALGPDNLETGMAVANLAAAKSAQGQHAEAASYFADALLIQSRHLGPSHPSLGFTLNNMAVLERARGNAAGAEWMFARALEILEPALGPDHRRVAACRANLDGLRHNDETRP